MKKLIMVVFTVVTFATLANAGIIQSTTDLTEAEFDNLVSDSVIAARLVFRAGGSSSWEMLADNNDGTILPGETSSGLTWSLNSGNAIIASWDANGSGNLEFTVTPSGGSPVVVSTSPTEWFDTILVSVENHYSVYTAGVILSSGDIDNESFRDISAPSLNTWDGIKIDLSGYNEVNQNPLTLSAVFTPEMYGPLGDEFRGEIFFLRAVPEPATMGLLGLAGFTIWVIRRARRSVY